jgi:DNA-binding MarR family transcriptional regulator
MLESSLLQFADQLQEIMPVIMRGLIKREECELLKSKITPAQFIILDFLAKKDESKMTDVAHFIGVTTAAMTGIVDRLVRDNYAVRVFDPKDRRIVKVRLTAKGIEWVKRIKHQKRQMTIRIFNKIPEAERQDYLRILGHIRDILEKQKNKIENE